MPKKTIVSEVASALGTAAARVESLQPKRSSGTKHARATRIEVPQEPSSKQVVEEPEAASAVSIDYAEVARLAYHNWQARNGHGGSPEEDWMKAEQEVIARSTR